MPSQSIDDRRAVQIVRYSPRPEEEDILSLSVQRERNEAYAVCEKLVIVKTFEDPETSARLIPLKDRDGGRAMLEYVAKHKIKHIIVTNVPRIFRDELDGWYWLKRWKKERIALHLADQGGNKINCSTPEGTLFMGVLLLQAAFEPRQTSHRTSLAMLHRQAHGQRQSGRCPFGKKYGPAEIRIVDGEEKRFTPLLNDIPEQLLGQEIQANALKGMSQRENAANLNARGFKFRGEPVKRSSVVAGLEYVASSPSPCSATQSQSPSARQ